MLLTEFKAPKGSGPVDGSRLVGYVKEVLEAAGFRVITTKEEKSDAELVVEATTESYGIAYASGSMFFNVEMKGQLSLKSSRGIHKAAFKGLVPGSSTGPIVFTRSDFLSAFSPLAKRCLGIEATRPATNALTSEVPWIRVMAARALSSLAEPNSVELLLHLLKDKDADIRRVAAFALGKIKDPAAVTPLVSLLQDENSGVQACTVTALGNIGDPKAVPGLIAVLRSSREALGEYLVREPTVAALAKIRDPRAVEPLGELLNSKVSWGLKQKAAWALGEIGGSEAVSPLVTELKSHSSGAAASATALVKIGAPAVEPLIAALKEEKDSRRRSRMVRTLGQLRDGRAAIVLIALLEDDTGIVRRVATEALSNIGRASVGPLVDHLTTVKAGEVSWNQAMHALTGIGEPAVEPLLKLLAGERQEDRVLAAHALGKIGTPRGVRPLLAALKDENAMMRRAAAHALGNISESADALKELERAQAVDLLKKQAALDKDFWARRAAKVAGHRIARRVRIQENVPRK